MTTIFKALFAAILDGVRAFFSERARDAAMREMGRAEQAAAINKETTDAQARMADANAAPRTRHSATDRLRDGSA